MAYIPFTNTQIPLDDENGGEKNRLFFLMEFDGAH